MTFTTERITGQDALMAVKDAIEKVRQAFILQGNSSVGKCLDGCVGLIYVLIEDNRANLFRSLFLLHGSKFLDGPVAGKFQDHYLVVGEDQQGKLFAVSPANFEDQNSSNVEILQANNPADLYQQISKHVKGYWILPETNRCIFPKITGQRGQPKLEITVGEWNPERSGFFTVVVPVDLFTQNIPLL